MGRDAAKACENQCFRCRKEAAKHNDKLGSREGAAELLGISVSSLADYELGNTKVIPVDKVVLMADIYNAPELMAWYCSSECLIGKSLEMPSPEIASVERTTMKLLKQLRQGDIEQVKEMFDLRIASDGFRYAVRKALFECSKFPPCTERMIVEGRLAEALYFSERMMEKTYKDLETEGKTNVG